LLLEAGGDLAIDGPGPEQGMWNVGIEDPLRLGRQLAVLTCSSGAIATSSIAVRNWVDPDGNLVHHLVDPRTGRPAAGGLVAVSVAHADPAWAEVWSKALFVGGVAEIGPEARARGLAAWWVEADGSLHLTPVARERTIWTASEAIAA